MSKLIDEFSVSNFDIRLPELGFMKFAMNEDDEDGGVYIMYFKMNDIETQGRDITSPGVRPYCFAKIKMGKFEKTLNRDYYAKLVRKVAALRSWLIKEDSALSNIRSLNREVKL